MLIFKQTTEWIKANSTKILVIAVAILIFLMWQTCQSNADLKVRLQQSENNVIALKDTVRIEKTKSGEVQYIKSALVSDLEQLKNLNLELYNEVKNQKKQIFYIAKMTASLQDTLKRYSSGDVATKDHGTGADQIVWNFDTTGVDWERKINGKSLFTVKVDSTGKYVITPKGSQLENFTQKFKLTTGLEASKSKKGMLEIFVRSSYPGMKFDNIDGAVVDPADFKKYLSAPNKRFSVGFQAGIGYGITLEKSPRFVPTLNVGFGIQYKLFSF